MTDEKKDIPDHTLASADIEKSQESPKIYSVTNLRAFVKPDLDEELGSPAGNVAYLGVEMSCSCVPVETCACNTVSYYQGGSPCDCTGTCVSLYWHPY